jgi:uroporphyrinogen decarboxylase
MGLGLSFAEGEGPRLARPLRDEAAVAQLEVPDLEKLRYVFDALTSVRRALNGRVPLIGFSGSPWTLACYMVEGGGSADEWRSVKSMVYSRPDLVHRILAVNADTVAGYLNAQIDAGAQAVMVFDSWGGALSHRAFLEFSLPYTARVLAQLQRSRDGAIVPRIVFTKGGAPWLAQMEQLDCEVLGVDWTVSLAQARAQVGASKALQGNLDPAVLFASPQEVAAEARRVLEEFGAPHRGPGSGATHIFNLGHGISQHTPPEHVQALVDAVHTHSAQMRQAPSPA